MSDFEHRNRTFDYTPPARGGSGTGALIFIGGILVLFILAIVFMGGGGSPLPAEGAAPAVTAPAVDPTAPVLGD